MLYTFIFLKLPNSISEIHFKRVILIDAHERNLYGSFCLAGKLSVFFNQGIIYMQQKSPFLGIQFDDFDECTQL